MNSCLKTTFLLSANAIAAVIAACSIARSRVPFSGDGGLLDFGSHTPIVGYQLILATLSNEPAQRKFTFSGIPSNEYWPALALNGLDLQQCWDAHLTQDKGLDVDVEVQDESTHTAILPKTRLSKWRVSFSPSPDWYDTDPPSRRCVLHADPNPHFKLNNDHTYTIEATVRQLELARQYPILPALEGKGTSGEL